MRNETTVSIVAIVIAFVLTSLLYRVAGYPVHSIFSTPFDPIKSLIKIAILLACYLPAHWVVGRLLLKSAQAQD